MAPARPRLYCWVGQVDDVKAQRVAFRSWTRWDRALRRHGSTPPPSAASTHAGSVGADGFDYALGSYFTKIAAEVDSAHAKDDRSGRSPVAILRDAVETYRVEDVELWWEWERASPRPRIAYLVPR